MHSTRDEQAIATIKAYCYSEHLDSSAAKEPVDPVAVRIRQRNRWRVKEALEEGKDYWQQRSCMRLDGFKVWLEKLGLTMAIANKYIRLYKTFANFSIDQIAGVDLTTLFTLSHPRYKQLLAKLQAFAQWTEAKVQELMSQFREQQKVEKPHSQTLEIGTGWRRLPGGARGYQLPLIYEDWLGVLIDKVRQLRNQTLRQLVKDMTLFFVKSGQVLGLTLEQLEIQPIAKHTNISGSLGATYARYGLLSYG